MITTKYFCNQKRIKGDGFLEHLPGGTNILLVLLMEVAVKTNAELVKSIDNIKDVSDSFGIGSGLPWWSSPALNYH
jgi:hypothetical protein